MNAMLPESKWQLVVDGRCLQVCRRIAVLGGEKIVVMLVHERPVQVSHSLPVRFRGLWKTANAGNVSRINVYASFLDNLKRLVQLCRFHGEPSTGYAYCCHLLDQLGTGISCSAGRWDHGDVCGVGLGDELVGQLCFVAAINQ